MNEYAMEYAELFDWLPEPPSRDALQELITGMIMVAIGMCLMPLIDTRPWYRRWLDRVQYWLCSPLRLLDKHTAIYSSKYWKFK